MRSVAALVAARCAGVLGHDALECRQQAFEQELQRAGNVRWDHRVLDAHDRRRALPLNGDDSRQVAGAALAGQQRRELADAAVHERAVHERARSWCLPTNNLFVGKSLQLVSAPQTTWAELVGQKFL